MIFDDLKTSLLQGNPPQSGSRPLTFSMSIGRILLNWGKYDIDVGDKVFLVVQENTPTKKKMIALNTTKIC